MNLKYILLTEKSQPEKTAYTNYANLWKRQNYK